MNSKQNHTISISVFSLDVIPYTLYRSVSCKQGIGSIQNQNTTVILVDLNL